MYLYRGHSASTSLGKELGVDEESNKKMILKAWRAVKKSEYIFSGFSRGSDNTMASNKKSTSKKEPTSVPEITI